MKKVTIPVPPLEVQREIVRILDQFTEKTNELKAALDAELTARKKQYEWYRRKLLSSIETLEVYCLKDLAIIKTGSKPNHIEDEPHDGMYEYINAGTTRSGYVTDCNCSGDTVTTPSRGQGGIGFVGYQQDPFWLGPLCYRITAKDNTQLSNEYLYYSLSNQTEDILSRKKEGGVPALNASDLGTIRIPLPELNVQKRIVDSLNRFKALCNDISEGLPAEIEARQKQHEYYRDKLLTFKEKTA